MYAYIRVGILLVGLSSPLLTFLALWQQKEWRVDRLLEHFRAEGFWRQVKGITRPLVILTAFALLLTPWRMFAGDIAIVLLACITVAQVVLRRQRYPVWTAKTVILLLLALAIDCMAIAVISARVTFMPELVLAVLALFQADAAAIAWSVFYPIDVAMKEKVMQKATRLRSAYTNMIVVGITGSVGKTTTKELIAHLLSGERNVIYTPAYVNSEMGVAKWLLRELPAHVTDEDLVMIVEMGAYRTGEIRKLCLIAKPTIGVVTYIGSQHIALFGSQEKLCEAKGELVAALPQEGTAILNGDSTLCAALADRCRGTVITVGTGGHADYEAFGIEETGKGIQFQIDTDTCAVSLHGTHNVTNVLLAIAAAETLDIPRKNLIKKLRTFTPPHNTFAVRNERGITLLDDTHNASPASFRASIAWAKAQPMERKTLVTPGLIELGTESQRIHRDLGKAAAGVFSRVIFTAKNGTEPFAEGYGNHVERFKKGTSPVERGDLLVCVGRVPQSIIDSLIPSPTP